MKNSEFWNKIAKEVPSIVNIDKVQYDSLDNRLIISLITTSDYDKSDADFIESKLSEAIPNLKITIKHELNNRQRLSAPYIEALFKSYTRKYPWLNHKENECCIKLFEDEVVLEVPNNTLVNFINKKRIIECLKDDIYKDCGNDVQVKIELVKGLEVEEFLELTDKQEQDISKLILSQKPIKQPKKASEKSESEFYIGKKIKNEPQNIDTLNQDTHWVTIEGTVFNIEHREIKDKKYIVNFHIYDETGATSCKAFWSEDSFKKFSENVNENSRVLVNGKYAMDSYEKRYITTINSITLTKERIILDSSEVKRVELRVHSQMSTLDGFVKIGELYSKLSKWNHKAVGITDRDVVQAFPFAMDQTDKTGIKTIYGLDATVVEDFLPIINNTNGKELNTDSYVVFDIETTGLSQLYDSITEIGAVKVKNGRIIEQFGELIKPERRISDKIVELTGITNEMVENKPLIDSILPKFLEFCEGSTLVAHNAEFDISFIREFSYRLNLKFNIPYIDTLYLSRFLNPDLRNHKLDTLARKYDVKLLNHHRAVDDAMATAEVFIAMLNDLKDRNIAMDENINTHETEWPRAANKENNMLILVKDTIGLKNLYKIVSHSNTVNLYKTPKVLKSFLDSHREGLLIGSGNLLGPLIQNILGRASEEEIEQTASYFDFLEIFPLDNFEHLVENSESRYAINSLEIIKDLNRKIIELGEKLDIPVVATGDVYYLNAKDHLYRDLIKTVQFTRNVDLSKNLYLKTTEKMLNQFEYLGRDKAHEVVVTNTNLIADMIEEIRPIPKGKYPPRVEGSDEELRELAYKNANAIYGENLPQIVEERLEKELNSIINNGYSVLYIIAMKLVLKSNEDGYVVGSRGSVGSSFVATMVGITEVNPLVAHYICKHCKYSEFITDGSYDSGIDMPDKICPECGQPLEKNGHNIPFEVFLGFEGNKEPDIDLNFAGEYQARCHKYTEELFGADHVFRAGTIGTIKENTAYGYIKKYSEKIDKTYNPAEIAMLQHGIVGVKRTTGQHPGGIIVVPNNMEVEDFTPISYPADDPSSGVITTHFTYKSVEDTILKLDLLGHDVPSIIKMLSDLTGIDANNIPLNDSETMEIFRSTDSLNIIEDFSNNTVGSLGIPEFGTSFVRQMLLDTRPEKFGELVRISGLSHGTNVWLNNAQDLIRQNQAVLGEVICTRDDIMTFLIQRGLEDNMSFNIMENVRKGKGLKPEHIEAMGKIDLPNWYVDSCMKIEYMFPKAHAVAYVLMSYRIAYFKVHHPEAFYATFFTIKQNDFPGSLVLKGMESVKREMERIRSLGMEASPKENSQYSVLEVAEEMYARGIKISNVSLGKSGATKFSVSKEGEIIPPFCALEDVSEQCSIEIHNEFKKSPFISIEDMVNRTRANKTAVESLRINGVLENLQETNQIDMFSMFDV